MRGRRGLPVPVPVPVLVVAVAAVVLGACSSDDSGTSARHATTVAPATTASAAPAGCKGLAPSGTYAVGRRQVELVDRDRPTAADPSRNLAAADTRTLAVSVLYPADGDPGEAGAFSEDAAFADGRYPVVIYSHGVDSDGTERNDDLARWARAGYVVLAPTFALSSHKGGQITDLANQPSDVMFVDAELRRYGSPLAGVADHSATDCLALAGHSLGALTTVGATMDPCCRPPGQKAAVSVAGGLYMPTPGADPANAPTVPLLAVHGDADARVPYDRSLDLRTRRGGQPTWLLTFPGGTHSDMFEPPRQEVLAGAVVGFLDAYLRGDREGLERMRTAASDGGARLDEPAQS